MGLMDKAKEAAQQAMQPVPGGSGASVCAGDHYVTEVNKGSINMGRWQAKLNEMYSKGYKLAHVVEQDGNTVQVFEHRTH